MKQNRKKEKIRIENNPLLSDIKSKPADEITELAESIINTVREPLLILDKDLRVVKANRSFFDFFKVSPGETIGALIYDLGNRKWDIPKLKELLEKILPEKTTFDNYEVEHDFAGIGNRILLLNARQIERTFGKEKIILLAIEDITKRKHLDESLFETNRMKSEYLDILVNHAHFPIIIWNASFVITRFNQSFEKLSGYDISEVKGKKIDFLFPENTRESTLKLLENSLHEEKFEIVEINILRKDKEIRTVLWNSANVFDKDGRIIIATVAQDINERKRVEDALKESEEIFNHFMEKSPYYVFFKDKNIRALRLSANYEQMLGKPLNSILGKTMDELFPSELAKKMIEVDKGILNRRETVIVEEEFNGRDFTTIKFPIIINDIPQYLAGFTIDITERKRAEEELNLLSARQSAILDSVPDIIMEVDKNKIYTWANFAGIEFFGDDVIGKEAAVYFEGEQNTYTKVQSVFNGSENIVYLESLQRRKDGEIRLLAWRCRVLKDQNGNVTGVLSAAQDITEQKRAEVALRENEKFLKETQKIAQLGSYTLDINTGIWKSSEILDAIFGIEPDYDKSIEGWTSIIHPEWQQLMADYFANEVAGQRKSFDKDYKIVRKSDKTERWVHGLGELVIDKENTPIKMIGTIRDITELKNAEREIVNLNRVYALLSNTNEAIVRIKDRQKLFDEICRIAIDNGKFRMAWIGIVNNDTNKVDVKASAGLIENYLEDINLDLNDEIGSEGPTGQAIKNGTNSIANDIEIDKNMLPWKENALRLGYKSYAAFPLNVFGKVIGVFSIYASQKDFFHQQEIRLLDEMAMDISFALEFLETEKNRKTVEENLRISEERFRITAENLTDIIFDWDIKENIHWYGDIDGIMGYPSGGFSRTFEAWAAAVHTEDKDRVMAALEDHLKGVATYAIEYRVRRKDGEWRWWSARGTALRDDRGEPYKMIGSITDITEQKDIQSKIKFNADLLSHVGQAVIATDLQGKVIYWNDAAEEIYGWSFAEAMGQNIVVLTPTEQTKEQAIEIMKVLSEGNSWSGEFLVKRKDGSVFPADVTDAPITDSDGKLIGTIGISSDITERKQSEEALQKSEERYRSVSQSANDAIITTDSKGIIIDWNKGAEKIFGYLETEISGKKLDIIIPKDDLAEHIKNREPSEQSGERSVVGKTVELQGLHKNGKEFPIELSLAEWEIPSGKFFTGIIRDITERKVKEKEIVMLANALRSVDDCVSITDMEDKIIFINQSFLRTYGYREDEVIGKDMNVFRSRKNPPALIEELKLSTLSGGWNGELWNKRKDGSEFLISLSTRLIADKDDKFFGLIGVASDITAQKQMVDDLLKLSSAVEQSPASIIITDIQGNIEYVNPKVIESSGYQFSELLGRNPKIFGTGEKSAYDYKVLWDTISSGKEWRGEFHNKKKNGEFYWESTSISAIKNNMGEIIHYLAVKEDITEQKFAEKELIDAKERAEQSDKLKSEFLAQMSHEIRTPLTAIVGNVDYLNESLGKNLDPDSRDCFIDIDLASKRIIRTIDLIINVAELQTSNYKSKSAKVDLNSEILDKLYQEHKLSAKRKGLEIIYTCKEKDPTILADEYCITQIFANLINNAIKFTRKGKIEILLEKNIAGNIIVGVKDTGIGISKEFLPRIFEPFIQEDQGLSRSFEGNGLGLVLVKGYCDLNNAQIEVESKKNVGSTFKVTFDKKVSEFQN